MTIKGNIPYDTKGHAKEAIFWGKGASSKHGSNHISLSRRNVVLAKTISYTSVQLLLSLEVVRLHCEIMCDLVLDKYGIVNVHI